MNDFDSVEKAGRELVLLSFIALFSILSRDELRNLPGEALGLTVSLLPRLSGLLVTLTAALLFRLFLIDLIYLTGRKARDFDEFVEGVSQIRAALNPVATPGVLPAHLEEARRRAESRRDVMVAVNSFVKKVLVTAVFIAPLAVGSWTVVIGGSEMFLFLEKVGGS